MNRLIGCVVAGALTFGGIAATSAGTAQAAAGRQQDYGAAAAAFGVPEGVLLAVSYLEARWDTNAGEPSTSGGFGPMHLTDASYVAGLRGGHGVADDPRGDDGRPTLRPASGTDRPTASAAGPRAESLQTLAAAAVITGADELSLRQDPATNIRGGAALLSSYQQALGGPTGSGSDPAAWYGAVARYSGADSAGAAAAFADEVFATIRTGAQRTTDDGQWVTLAGRAVQPDRSWLDRLGLRPPARSDDLECPRSVSCEWVPAPYATFGVGNYGNHDLSDRPARQQIKYIVLHDTEASWDTTLDLVQDPTYVSWHYSLRSVDGQIAQHVKVQDVAWHAGNWYVNAKAVGLEHEGFAAEGTWYTEAMYRTSAKLVRYLARQLDIPLDRQHIIGHDNVAGPTPSTVRGMHWDPGPYWDWSHYFDLLGRPLRSTGTARTGLVTIAPDFTTNRPAFTGCLTAGEPCPDHGSSAVVLRTAPSIDAPLVNDIALRPDGTPNTMNISDSGARVSAGQTYAVAEWQRDWTAIWYLGHEAWFHNPSSAPTGEWSTGLVATPKAGKATIPVYGRAYPEPEAYPAGVPVQAIVPLQYTLAAGQRYAVGDVLGSEYYRATTFDGSSPGDWTVIRGRKAYAQIQFGHRIMYVDRADVDLHRSSR